MVLQRQEKQHLQTNEHNPKECADVVFQNSNFEDPLVICKGI
ncbi:Protein of unknown function [Bacillus cereus]|nr:Protein of unknown function [Bacillus cereus]